MTTSASVHTNSWDGRTITLLVEETATSIENNTSTVKWTLTSGTSSTYHNVYEITAWVNGTADANKVYGPKTATWDTRAFPCKDGSTSGTILIQHNADGTASPVTFRLRGSVRNNSPQNYDGSIDLTTIPRASSFTISKTSGGTAATSWNLGEALYVNITRASSSFTHKVYFVVGNSGNQVISNSAGTSANTTLASSLAQYIPSSSATATIYVDTYSGTTKIGTATKTFTINVPSNVLPSISSVTKTDTAGYLSTYNAYVQGKSNLRVQTSASGNYSSITNYTVKLKNSGGTILNTKTGNDVTFSNISYVGTITVEVTVTDSRNRTATNSSTITVATYNNPTITTFSAERQSNNATVTLTYNASITNINNRNVNAKTFRIYKRQKGTSSWGNAIATYTSGYTYSGSTTTSCDENYGWEFKLEAQDSFTTTTKTDEVGTTFELMNWKADGTGMAIGKVSETSNAFEVDLATVFYKNVITRKNSGDTFFYVQRTDIPRNAGFGIGGSGSLGIYDWTAGKWIFVNTNDTSTFNGNVIFTNQITGKGGLELSSSTPYIDFHYNSSSSDYTSRIIESSSGTLSVSNNFTINGDLKTKRSFLYTLDAMNAQGRFYKLINIPPTSDGNACQVNIRGSLGNWTGDKATINLQVSNRNSLRINAEYIGSSKAFDYQRIVVYQESNGSHTVYLSNVGGYTGPNTLEITWGGFGNVIPTITTDYSYTTTPTGTWKYSSSISMLSKPVAEVVLYDNTTGTNGNVTLSETAANFTYMEIFFRDNGNTEFHSEKIYSPNGKSTTIGFIRNYVSGSNLYVYLFSKNITINGTTITHNRGSYIQFLNKTINSNTSDNYVYITRVVGYR